MDGRHDARRVRVAVVGTDGKGDRISLETTGMLYDEPGAWFLSYEETHPDSLAPSETLVECRGGRVTVMRADSAVTTLIYQENETFVSEYQTPLGTFLLRLFATKVSARRAGGAGRIRLTYQITLSSGLSPAGETAMRRLDIRFRPWER